MPNEQLTSFLLLPELKLMSVKRIRNRAYEYNLVKESKFEVCPKCATKSSKVHDRRWITVKDAPIHGKIKIFKILKRRFRCTNCKSVFTEPVSGINKGARITQRMQRHILWSCENFTDLKKVRRDTECGNKTIYNRLYQQLELEHREQHKAHWPKTIGIDEHSWLKNKDRGHREFATVFVEYKGKRIREVAEGKTAADLHAAVGYIPGRERVKNVVMDLCAPYKSFVQNFFPNADIIADKFHVLRLLHPAINRRRKGITGDKRKNPLRKMLLKNGAKLHPFERKAIWTWLNDHPELKEIYFYKEAMHRLYRCKGYARAKSSLINLLDQMASSKVSEIKTLRRTLQRWSEQILNYFKNRITNARTEGFNNVAKLVQKRAFGYRNFGNYRLRLLYASR